MGRGRLAVTQALEGIRRQLPFKLLGIHPDCGSEFINAHLLSYCQEHEIAFTRSRPEHKNDNCHVLGDNPWHYRVVEGTARIEDSGDQLLDHLVEYYRAAAGEHPNWDEYRAAMVNEGRLLAWIHIDRILNPTGA